MNNLDKITEKIKADALSEAVAIVSAAENEAKEIKEDAKNQANDILAFSSKKSEKDAFSIVQRAYSAAEMKKREIILATKVGLINKAFSDAEEKLINLGDEDYRIFCAHLLADAVEEHTKTVEKLRFEYGDEEEYSLDFKVSFNERDSKKHAKAIIKTASGFLKEVSEELGKTKIEISKQTVKIGGGFILSYGDTETNCSIEKVVAASRENAESEVSKLLFS